jgi:uncharacterized Tic20 family protein
MNHRVTLTITSLLSIVLFLFHWVDVGGRIATHSPGAFFWVWTLIALGVCAVFSIILSAHGLWKLPWGRSGKSELEGR